MTRVLDPETGEIKLKVNEELTRSLSGGIGLEHKPKPSAEAKDRLIQALDEIEFEALENVSRSTARGINRG